MYGGEVSVQCGSIPEGKLGCIELFSLLCLCFVVSLVRALGKLLS